MTERIVKYMGWTIEKALWRQLDRGEAVFHTGWKVSKDGTREEFITLADAKAWVRKKEGKSGVIRNRRR